MAIFKIVDADTEVPWLEFSFAKVGQAEAFASGVNEGTKNVWYVAESVTKGNHSELVRVTENFTGSILGQLED